MKFVKLLYLVLMVKDIYLSDGFNSLAYSHIDILKK